MFPPGTAFCLSGTFTEPQHVLTRWIAAKGGRCMFKVKRTDYLVVGNKASLLDIQGARERDVPIITESQLRAWVQWGEAPKILSTEQVLAVAQGMEYDYLWGDKPPEMGAF